MMIAHYLRNALAKFRKSPFTTGANVLTLALGLACFIAAYGIATYWRSADSHHPGAERIVYIAQAAFGGEFGTVSSSSLPYALRREIPELEAVAQFQGSRQSSMNQAPYSAGDRDAFLTTGLADAALFDVFGFEFVEGGRNTAFRALNDVVITEPAARRLFGDRPALGQSLSFLGLMDFTVSAVIAPARQPSFMGDSAESPVSFDVLQNVASRMPESAASWNRLFGMTAVRLPESLPVAAFQARLDGLAARASEQVGFEIRLDARPISDLTTQLVNARLLSQEGGLAGVSASAILLALGALILAVACANAANLAAAQAEARVREAGMRKVLGAGRRALLAQHMVETGLLTAAALAVAVLVVALADPVFQTVLGVRATHFLTAGPGGVLFLVAVALASVAATALYPAFVMARVRASDALGGARRRVPAMLRVLVAVQFLLASFLVIVVTVTQLQQAHLQSQFRDVDLGNDVVVYLDWIPGVENLAEIADDGPRESDFSTFATTLLAAPQIRAVTAVDSLPLIDSSGSFGSYAMSAEAADFPTVQEKNVGADFVETMGVRLLAGRAFDPARDRTAADAEGPRPVMIDRRLAASLGYAEPAAAIGQTLYAPTGQPGEAPALGRPAATVVGVVESDTSRPIAELGAFGRIAGVAYRLDLDYVGAQYPAIRVDGADIPGALAAIQRAWAPLQPDQPLRVRFADDLFQEGYASFRKIASAFIALSVAALVISTTGILGVAVHVAARRTREIGVRKTLGASTARVLRMLIVDFSKPVLIGNLLAWPFAYAATQIYLQPFAERAPLTPAPFILSLVFTLLLAWLSVGGQAWRAASLKPALVLRTE